MRHYENDCAGCPQGCIHCGRQNDYIVLSCDKCGEDIAPIYDYMGLELCMECIMEDGVTGICEGCGRDELLVEGLCKWCLSKRLDEIRED